MVVWEFIIGGVAKFDEALAGMFNQLGIMCKLLWVML